MTLQSSAPFDVLGQLTALRRYARSLTRSDVDAEDLVHDALVFVRLMHERPVRLNVVYKTGTRI